MSEIKGLKIIKCGKSVSGGRMGSAEWNFQGQVVGGGGGETEIQEGSEEVGMG